MNCGQVDICCAKWWKVVSYCCCSCWHLNGDAGITKKLNPLYFSAGRMEACMMKPEVKKKPKSVRTFTANTDQTQAMHNSNTSPIQCCQLIYSLQGRCFSCWSEVRVLAQMILCTNCILNWTSFPVEFFKPLCRKDAGGVILSVFSGLLILDWLHDKKLHNIFFLL